MKIVEFIKKPIVKRVSVVLIAVSVAGFSTIQLKNYLVKNQPTEKILVAKKDIPAYAVVTSSDLGYVTKPIGSATNGSIQDPKEIVGKVTKTPIFTGEEVHSKKLANSPLVLAQDERAVGVPIDIVKAVGMDIVPGDRVDVYWFPSAEGNKLPSNSEGEVAINKAQPIATAATILDVLNKDNASLYSKDTPIPNVNDTQNERGTNVSSSKVPAVAVIKVKNTEVQNIFTAIEKGNLYFAKRQ